MRNLLLSLTVALGMTTQVCARTSPWEEVAVNPDISTIVLEGVITGSTLRPLNEYFDTFLSGKEAAPYFLNMVINSPGGSVTAGFMFINKLKALQARGVVVRCYVAEYAASMAYQIFLQCDERYALNTSFLLWHRARVSLGGMFGQAMTGPMLFDIGEQLLDLDSHIFNDISNLMAVSEKYLNKHFERETLHTGYNLNKACPDFLDVQEAIPGLMESLANPKLVRSQKDFGIGFQFGELIYIWEDVLVTMISK